MSRRFRIRSLFVLLFVLSVACAVFRATALRYHAEQQVLNSLSDQLFGFSFKRTFPRYAAFLPERIGEKFGTVTRLEITGGEINEDEGYITETREFTDEEFVKVLGLKHLKHLSLAGTSITPENLVRLAELKLNTLNLSGIASLSPELIEQMQRANPDCRFCLSWNHVDVEYLSENKFRVQRMECRRDDLSECLANALEGVMGAGYTKVNITLRRSDGPASDDHASGDIVDSHYRESVQLVRNIGAKLGYDQMSAWKQGGHDFYDLKTGNKLVLRENARGILQLQPEE